MVFKRWGQMISIDLTWFNIRFPPSRTPVKTIVSSQGWPWLPPLNNLNPCTSEYTITSAKTRHVQRAFRQTNEGHLCVVHILCSRWMGCQAVATATCSVGFHRWGCIISRKLRWKTTSLRFSTQMHIHNMTMQVQRTLITTSVHFDYGKDIDVANDLSNAIYHKHAWQIKFQVALHISCFDLWTAFTLSSHACSGRGKSCLHVSKGKMSVLSCPVHILYIVIHASI